jgi:alkylhydroperoxidase family enzyme
MIRTILVNILRRFEKRYNYDAAYIHDLLTASPRAFWALQGARTLASYQAGAPPVALAAAGLAATLSEDCGPCVQIGVRMAEENGVPADVLRAILAGDTTGMGADAALAYQFAKASLNKDLDRADPLREAVLAQWGGQGLSAIALAIAASRVYPTIKYAMGHGKACSRVQVGDDLVAVRT